VKGKLLWLTHGAIALEYDRRRVVAYIFNPAWLQKAVS
jgi:hypothetical protein